MKRNKKYIFDYYFYKGGREKRCFYQIVFKNLKKNRKVIKIYEIIRAVCVKIINRSLKDFVNLNNISVRW